MGTQRPKNLRPRTWSTLDRLLGPERCIPTVSVWITFIAITVISNIIIDLCKWREDSKTYRQTLDRWMVLIVANNRIRLLFYGPWPPVRNGTDVCAADLELESSYAFFLEGHVC